MISVFHKRGVSSRAILGPTAALPYVRLSATGPLDILARGAKPFDSHRRLAREKVAHVEQGGTGASLVRRDW